MALSSSQLVIPMGAANGHIDRIQVHLLALPLNAWGLARLVESAQPRLALAGVAATPEESLSMLAQGKADVVLLDLDGGDVGLVIAHARTGAKVLVLSSSSDQGLHDQAVLAGARGVVHKREPSSVLLKAIERVHEGEIWIDRSATGRIFLELARQKAEHSQGSERSKIAMLTRRERQTIVAVAGDASATGAMIAARLYISQHTLRNHLTSIYNKLGLTNRVELYAYAHQHGLNQPV